MKISFWGGAQSVTGANYLVESGQTKIIIDCGLFQGSKFAEELNYQKFNYNPAELQAVFVTHAHTDHMGRLPKLFKEGFRGEVFATEPTAGMIAVALPDNLSLMKDEARRDNHPPLYDQEDVTGILTLFRPQKYYEPIKISEDMTVTLFNAGHVLGSAIIEVIAEGKKLYFTGDLGNPPMPLLPQPDNLFEADYVVMESAYGDRLHEDRESRRNILEDAIEDVFKRKGTLMIPSFAIERTQEILFDLNGLVENDRIPRLPIFIDSPLAIKITEEYKKYQAYFNEVALDLIKAGDEIFDFPQLKMTRSPAESKAINKVPGPKVVIAGSGMSTGGRILHHEKMYLDDPNSIILFVGYQVKNSLGRRILDGEKEVKIFGEHIFVKAEVRSVSGYSAHADQSQLAHWLMHVNEKKTVKRAFIVQGDEEASQSLAVHLRDKLLIDTVVPKPGESFELD